jgi:hypothetical protein
MIVRKKEELVKILARHFSNYLKERFPEKELTSTSLLAYLHTEMVPNIVYLCEMIPEDLYPLKINDQTKVNPIERALKRCKARGGNRLNATEEDVKTWVKLYNPGLTIRDIGIITGWSPETIRKGLHSSNVSINRRRRPYTKDKNYLIPL